MKNTFLNAIHVGKYHQAKELVKNMSFENLYDMLLKISFEESSLTAYSFLVFLLIDTETAQIHHAASVIMSTALSHYNDAFSVGLLHARRAAVLEPLVLKHQEWLLSFYDIPDQVMSDKEAFNIAQHILKYDSTNAIALKALETITTKSNNTFSL
jgi:hypothetical protein